MKKKIMHEGMEYSSKFRAYLLGIVRPIFIAILSCGMAIGQEVKSGGAYSDTPVLVPFFDISNSELSDFATAISYVFSIENLSLYLDRNIENINLFFISKPNAIRNKLIDPSVLGFLGDESAATLSRIKTDSDECFVQSFFLDDGREIIVAINVSDNGAVEVDKKCFLLAVGLFDHIDPQKIEEIGQLRSSDAAKVLLNINPDGEK